LTRTKFSLPTVDCETIQLNFENAFVLMSELGRMGEGNSVSTRRKDKIQFDTLLATSAIYQGFYEAEKTKEIPATFQIIYLIGWKEHHSQQKPKERGSATFSLKELSSQMQVPLGTINEEEDVDQNESNK
jgi:NADH dehydrogenase [ubiquinone] 1 alpha subcomplex assembly factor 5